MKALSVRAPWWWFILHTGKDIENRDWPTNFRGTIYLHASKWYSHIQVTSDLYAMDQRVPGLSNRRFAASGLQHPYVYLKRHCGAIVGTIDIVDCVTKSDSPWFFGRYGFVLANPVAFANQIPYKGALGFFSVSDDVQRAINEVKACQS